MSAGLDQLENLHLLENHHLIENPQLLEKQELQLELGEGDLPVNRNQVHRVARLVEDGHILRIL